MLGLSNSVSGSSYTSLDLKERTSSLELWFKNNTGVTAAKWTDSSGNDNHATQSTEGNQATVSGGGLDFEEGNSEHYDLTSKITISANQGFCIAFVFTPEATGGNCFFSDGSSEMIQLHNASQIRIKTNDPGQITTDAIFESGTFNAGTKFLVLINRSAGASNRFTFFKNGTQLTPDTDTSSNEAEGENPNGLELSIFGSRDGSANFLDGIVDEIAFWSKGLNAQEIADVNSYLKEIHGL